MSFLFVAYFSIDSLGLLHSIKPLDRELKDVHHFNVLATDGEVGGRVCNVY